MYGLVCYKCLVSLVTGSCTCLELVEFGVCMTKPCMVWFAINASRVGDWFGRSFGGLWRVLADRLVAVLHIFCRCVNRFSIAWKYQSCCEFVIFMRISPLAYDGLV